MLASTAQCTECSKPLDVHERVSGNTCKAPPCKQAALQRRVQREQREKVALAAVVEAAGEAAAADLGIAGAPLNCAVLPSLSRPLAPLGDKRKRQFRDHLQRVLSEAASVRYRPGPATTGDDRSPGGYDGVPHKDSLVASACGLCRGNCCQLGKEHAFLRPETIVEYWQREPSARPREIFDAYLSYLGNHTVEGSCVFHGAEGCALPREMRSFVCNEYLCGELCEWLALVDVRAEAFSFLAATEGQELLREVMVTNTGRPLSKAATAE